MKVKIFKDESFALLCQQMNDFSEEEDVKAGQYKPVVLNGQIVFTAMVWYKPKVVDVNTPQVKKVEG